MRQRMNDFDSDEKDFVSRVTLPACPEVGMLHAAHEGVLADAETKQIQEHLSSCEVCRTLFDDLDAIEYGELSPAESASIRVRIARNAPRAFEPARKWWVPALAVAAAAAIAFVLIRVPKPETPAQGPLIVYVKPPQEIKVEKLPIRVDPTSLLATRGGNGSQPSGPELAKALAKYQGDDYASAVQQLKALAQKYPKDGTVRLYLGISELLLNQNKEASADLSAAANELEGGRQSDAQWYLAAASLRLKDHEAAQPLLQQLCEGKSTYTERACKLESELK
ncbi:hypothetical protein Acid345_0293 [Candidatus Koribacter versatilis Ellin345]|uniref:Putative zinc-finger domain-containing protein n=1 Tax=Koribacter versatilis (strain Ellin345) TaxID=204669 RepID=Q1IV02_KORVE|nr:zf-HC2 domain-containing protein [Candidatus Koribacter versatilis]ABF39298.1 hypothetical protein Acid345_0293 [Candidatus Koribacter versatilis Ellin345]